MGRHAARRSIFSIIVDWVFIGILVFVVISSIFGSWEGFLAEMIQEIPWGGGIFKIVAGVMDSGIRINTGQVAPSFGDWIKDFMKLLIAAVILPIVKYFFGYVVTGKHAAERTLLQRVGDFITESLFLPACVAMLSSWIVGYLSNMIWSVGGVWAWILSIAGSAAAIGVSVWAFCALAAAGVFWGIGYMFAKIIPAMLILVFSYALWFAMMILVSDPVYSNTMLYVIIGIIGILLMIGGLDGVIGGFFKKSNSSGLDWM
ncbi:MAG: hypothetical protein IJP38_05665 [Oscillospiraceae bacterium]|nr:hypothetical protein [Oscillospiraceae bacterium]